MTRKLLTVCLVVSLFVGFSFACVLAAGPTLKDSIDAALTGKHLEKVRMSVRIVDCSSGEVLYDLKSDRPMAPASNGKLFVTAAAMELLGPGYQYSTIIYRDGELKDGVIDGNLVLQGSGDPNFTGRFYDGNVSYVPHLWAKQISDAGIRRITGDLVCDDSLFDRTLVNPIWPERHLQDWYAPQVSALNFNENCVDIYVAPGKKVGDPAIVTSKPDTAYVQIVNTCKTSSSKTSYPVISRILGTNRISVAGGVYVKSGPGVHSITVHQPALYLGTVLSEELARAGVKIDGKVRFIEGAHDRVAERDPRTLAIFHSKIPVTIAVTNKFSQDCYAEAMLRLLGTERGKGGTIAEGLSVIDNFLTEKVHVAPGSVTLVDGSGLSDKNRCSAKDLTDLMVYMSKSSNARDFMDSLSIAGVDGTMAKRLTEKPYRGNVFGKTGTINNVRTLTGYVRTRSKRLIAFSILASSVSDASAVLAARDKVCKILYDR